LISSSALLFSLVKLITLGMVSWVVRWANNIFPYVIFVALFIFTILVGTVSAANILTVLKS